MSGKIKKMEKGFVGKDFEFKLSGKISIGWLQSLGDCNHVKADF